MTINLAEDRHSVPYNALITRIKELHRIASEPHLVYSISAELSRLAGELEDLYIQGMRDASTSTNLMTTKFQQRHQALMKRVVDAETQLQALEQETQGPGTFVRHGGYAEVTDVRGEIHQIPLVYVRDQRGVEGRVAVTDPNIDVNKIQFGQKLLLMGTHAPGAVMGVLDEFSTSGREANIVAIMDKDHQGTRVMLSFGEMQENRVCWLADNVADKAINAGSRVLVDPTGMLVTEVLPEKESSRYLAAEIPSITFADIGGLDHIAVQMEEDFIWPLLHVDLFKKAKIPSPRGCLFSGPPGTGKTMIAQAVTNLIAHHIEKMTGLKATGYFFNIKGPELLNKYVGESERGIREIFEDAKKIASDTTPVVIFIDEMDALFLTRGHGISSDVNLTIVPQFTTMMQGLQDRGNVIVIGATNRRELIDPAVIRPGRIDKVIEIPRPDAAAAKQIFGKYLLPSWDQINPRYDVEVYHPLDSKGNPKPEEYHFKRDPQIVAKYLIDRAVERMYDTTLSRNEFIELTFDIGRRIPSTTILRYGDLASGALIENIVARAKKRAVHDHIMNKTPFGVEMKHVYLAIEDAFGEQRAPQTAQDIEHWLMIQGYSEGRLINMRFVKHDTPHVSTAKINQESGTLPSSAIAAEEEAEEF